VEAEELACCIDIDGRVARAAEHARLHLPAIEFQREYEGTSLVEVQGKFRVLPAPVDRRLSQATEGSEQLQLPLCQIQLHVHMLEQGRADDSRNEPVVQHLWIIVVFRKEGCCAFGIQEVSDLQSLQLHVVSDFTGKSARAVDGLWHQAQRLGRRFLQHGQSPSHRQLEVHLSIANGSWQVESAVRRDPQLHIGKHFGLAVRSFQSERLGYRDEQQYRTVEHRAIHPVVLHRGLLVLELFAETIRQE